MSKRLLFSIPRDDFKIEFMRGSGPGGQKRNKTESAVRMTHKASGATAYSCDERSQRSNILSAFRHVIERPEFKTWLQLEIARKNGTVALAEAAVDRAMDERNIKTEIQRDGKWCEVTVEELDV